MSETGNPDDHRTRRTMGGENELTAQLITAASGSSEHLSQEEVDDILGVSGDDGPA